MNRRVLLGWLAAAPVALAANIKMANARRRRNREYTILGVDVGGADVGVIYMVIRLPDKDGEPQWLVTGPSAPYTLPVIVPKGYT